MYMSIAGYPEIKALPPEQRKQEVMAFMKACPQAKSYQMLIMLPTVVFIIGGFIVMNVVFKIGGAVGGGIAGAVGGVLGVLVAGPPIYSGPVRRLFEQYWARRSARQ